MKVCLFLDHACNLRCTYCYNGEKFSKRMPWEVAQRGIDMLFSGSGGGCSAFPLLSFFGGEPLMSWDLLTRSVEYAEAEARRRNTRVGFLLTTNGTLLDEEKRRYLHAHRFYLGLSLDGSQAAHDATRRTVDGHSSWQRTADNLSAWLRDQGGTGTRVIAVIDPANVEHLPDSFDTLLGLGVRNLSMNPNFEADWDDEARQAYATALRGLGERYAAAWRSGQHFNLNLLDSKIVTRIKGGYAGRDRCDFGCEEIAVAPSGRLYPCDRLVGEDDRDDVVVGDVFTGVDAARRDALVASKNAVLSGCDGCALQSRCMHWCGCVNYAMTGSVGDVSGLLCWFEQQAVQEADRVASQLFSEKNAGFVKRFYKAAAPC